MTFDRTRELDEAFELWWDYEPMASWAEWLKRTARDENEAAYLEYRYEFEQDGLVEGEWLDCED